MRDIGESSVVVVVKQRGMRRLFLAVQRIEGRAIDQVNVEPAVVVVIDQAHARAVGLDNEVLLRHAHLVSPSGKSRLFGDVLEDHGAGIDKSTCGDGTLLCVVHRRRRYPRSYATTHAARLRLLSTAHARKENSGAQNAGKRTAKLPQWILRATDSLTCVIRERAKERSTIARGAATTFWSRLWGFPAFAELRALDPQMC